MTLSRLLKLLKRFLVDLLGCWYFLCLFIKYILESPLRETFLRYLKFPVALINISTNLQTPECMEFIENIWEG